MLGMIGITESISHHKFIQTYKMIDWYQFDSLFDSICVFLALKCIAKIINSLVSDKTLNQ